MTRRPQIARTLPALNRVLAPYHKAGLALVPTMGALHDGHIALVRQARRKAKRVVVSIFVNPTQFAPHEDFGSYPRTFTDDLRKLAAEKVDAVWAPTPAVMYPDGFALHIEPAGAAKAGLEDKFRPHFFGGVATVVAKLLLQCRPDFAMFGQKDYQQLRVVTQLASDLDLATKIIGCTTVREKDGLALSSRNVYLSPQERAAAPVLNRTLRAVAAGLRQGQKLDGLLADGRAAITEAGFALDYLEARHALSLEPIASLTDGPVRLLVAAKIGRTRLIDNIGV